MPLLVGLVLFGLALSIAAHSVWVGLLVAAGVTLLSIGVAASLEHHRDSAFYLLAVSGIGVIVGASLLADFAGGWLWVLLWLWVGFVLVAHGVKVREYARGMAAGVSFLLGAACCVFAFVGPAVLGAGLRVSLPTSVMPGGGTGWLWVSATGLGIASLLLGWKRGLEYRPGSFALFSALGLALLVTVAVVHGSPASGLAAYAWPLVWLGAGALVFHGAWRVGAVERRLGWSGIAAALGCAAFAVWAGIRLFGAAPSSAGPSISFAALGQWALAVGGFLVAVVGSVWGIVYLLLLFAVGLMWLKRWGGFIALALLLGAIGWKGAQDAAWLEGLANLLRSGPATLSLLALESSTASLGTPGWAVIFGGMGLLFLLFPGLRESVLATRLTLSRKRRGSRVTAEEWAEYFRARGVSSYRSVGAILIYVVTSVWTVIALWVGLRRLSGAGGELAFPVLGLPDITVAHFSPVWHPSYFVVALLLGVVAVVRIGISVRLNVMEGGGLRRPVPMLIVSLLFALVVPAGVLLFLIGGVLTATLGTVVACRIEQPPEQLDHPAAPSIAGFRELQALLRAAVQETPTPGQPPPQARPRKEPMVVSRPPEPPGVADRADAARADEAEPRPPPEEIGAATVPFEPGGAPTPPSDEPGSATIPFHEPHAPGSAALTLESRLLFEVEDGISDLVASGDGRYMVLIAGADEERGRLEEWMGGKRQWSEVPRAHGPFFMAQPEGGDVLVAGRWGPVTIISRGDDAETSVRESEDLSDIECCALNSFGTLLAYASRSEARVYGLFLAGFQEQRLTGEEDLPAALSALVFSRDGRRLAMGDVDGRVRVLDMAKRRLGARVLSLGAIGERRVVCLATSPEGLWIAGHDDGSVAAWTTAGELVHVSTPGAGISAVACGGAQCAVAVGCADGSVHVMSPDLRTVTSCDYQHAGEVTRIAALPGGGGFATAGRDGSARLVTVS